MTDTSWRAPEPTPVRRRRLMIRAGIALGVLIAVVALLWAVVPSLREKSAASEEEEAFNSAVETVIEAPAVEVTGRAKMHSAGSAVFFTAVRLDDGTLAGDVRPEETGTGLPLVDTGNKVYAQGNPGLWPLMGLGSEFTGWVEAPSAETISIQSASVTQDNVREVYENDKSKRDGMTMTSPEGVVITVEEDGETLHVTFPLEEGAVSEHTIRPVSDEEAEAAKQAVANAVSTTGARVIQGPGGNFIIEPFAGGGGNDAPVPAPAPEPEPAPAPAPEPAPAPAPEPAPAPAPAPAP